MASPALPGLFFCLAAAVLLIIVSISAPTWDKISFLDVGATRYGVFGYTGSRISIGYYFGPGIDSNVLHSFTIALILNPIAAGLAGLAVLFGLCGICSHRVGTIFMSILAGLATVVTFVIWIIDMAVFGTARKRFRAHGQPASFGNANWMVLGALVALLLATCTGVCGIFGRYRKRNRT